MKMLRKLFFMMMVLFTCGVAYAKGEDFSKVSLKDVSGKEYVFGKSQKETYVKFWASWCPVCLAGLEELNDLSKETKDFEIVTVVFPGKKGEKERADFNKWYQSLEYKNIKVLLDEKGELLKQVNPRVYPTSVVLNRDAKVQKIIPGHLGKEEIEKLFSSSMNQMTNEKKMEKVGASKSQKEKMMKEEKMMMEKDMKSSKMNMKKKTVM